VRSTPSRHDIRHAPACCHDVRVRDVRGGGLAGFRRYTWWSLTGTDVGFLVGFGAGWIRHPALTVGVRLLAIVALGVLVAVVVVLMRRRLPAGVADAEPVRLGLAWPVAGGVAAVVLAAIALALGEHGTWSLPPAIVVSIVAAFLARRPRRILIGVTALGAAVVGGIAGVLSGAGWLYPTAIPAGMVAFVAWVTLGMLWAWDLAERLDRSRGLAAELAVADERLRFAADLHDIQGHHLQVIALKSELAARLAAADPARAAAEMTDVQRLATDALRDTRAVAAGYRRTSLDAEIANAARVLAAADIDTRLELEPVDPGALSESGRHLLGLVMREATTNVLRHSRARTAEVAYRVADGVARLRVGNDGAPAEPGPVEGTGLSALEERLAATGGSLSWERDGDRFEVVASLPVGEVTGGTGAP
jgi:two-component system sensor histidine kinase DesK